LEYELTKDNGVEKEIQISVPATELNTFINKEADKLQKKLTLRGFRKGKVPKNLIKTRYHDTLKAQAMDNLVTKSYLKILEEKKWRPASRAELLNIEEGEKITFRLQFEVIPDFDVDNYQELEIFKDEPMPDDFLFEQGINELRERFATVKEVSRPTVVDDLVTADVEIIENNSVQSKQTDLTIRVGDRNYPDEVNRALVGAKKSENKQVRVGNLLYKMSIKKIEEKNLPNVDDDFAKKQNYENVEDLKKKLMDDLKKIEEKRIEEELKESLSNVILERIRFTVPKSLIQNEYQKILQRSKLPDSDATKERFWNFAEKRARFNLILDKIAEKENIRVEEKEIMNLISAMNIKLNDENRDDIIHYLSDILGKEKTIDFLYKNAKISKKGRIISPKEAINDTRTIRH